MARGGGWGGGGGGGRGNGRGGMTGGGDGGEINQNAEKLFEKKRRAEKNTIMGNFKPQNENDNQGGELPPRTVEMTEQWGMCAGRCTWRAAKSRHRVAATSQRERKSQQPCAERSEK